MRGPHLLALSPGQTLLAAAIGMVLFAMVMVVCAVLLRLLQFVLPPSSADGASPPLASGTAVAGGETLDAGEDDPGPAPAAGPEPQG